MVVSLAACAGFGAYQTPVTDLPKTSYREISRTASREDKLGPLAPALMSDSKVIINNHDAENAPNLIVELSAPVAFPRYQSLGSVPAGSHIGILNHDIEWIVLAADATIAGHALPAHSLVSGSGNEVLLGGDLAWGADHLHAGDRLEIWMDNQPRPSSVTLAEATSIEGKRYHKGDVIYYEHGKVSHFEAQADHEAREHEEGERERERESSCWSTCKGVGGDFNECSARCH